MQKASRTRVLLVDDNKPMRILVREMLLALGFVHCHEAHSTEQALAELDSIAFDLIITDLVMPGDNGILLVKAVRDGRGQTSESVPIIVMSGHAEPPSVAAVQLAGVDSFLVKPISAVTLAHHVARVLKYSSNEPRLRDLQRRVYWRTGK